MFIHLDELFIRLSKGIGCSPVSEIEPMVNLVNRGGRNARKCWFELKGGLEDAVECGAILEGEKKQEKTNWQKMLV